jgi:hypothetical protein
VIEESFAFCSMSALSLESMQRRRAASCWKLSVLACAVQAVATSLLLLPIECGDGPAVLGEFLRGFGYDLQAPDYAAYSEAPGNG